MLDVIDAALNLIEPGGTMNPDTALRTATSGTTVDHTGAKPIEVEFDVDRLWAWSGIDRHETMEAGRPSSVRERFTIDLMYVVASGGEQAKTLRSRAVSLVLDAKAHTYLGIVAVNVALAGAWESMLGEINPDVIRSYDVRGIGLRLNGWRYIQGA